MASVRADEIEQNVLNCAVCKEAYKNPRQLPCAHIFCLDCLTNCVQTSQHRRRPLIKCPLCRERHYIAKSPIENLPKPHFIGEIQDMVEKARRKSPITCKDHGDKRIKFLCLDCSELVCTSCLVGGKHKGHPSKDIPVFADQLREQLNNKLADKVKASAHLQTKADHAQSMSDRVYKKYEEIHKSIDTRAESIMNEVKKHRVYLHDLVQVEEDIITARLKDIQATIHSYADSLSSDHILIKNKLANITNEELIADHLTNPINKPDYSSDDVQQLNVNSLDFSVAASCVFNSDVKLITSVFGFVQNTAGIVEDTTTRNSLKAFTYPRSMSMGSSNVFESNHENPLVDREPENEAPQRRSGQITFKDLKHVSLSNENIKCLAVSGSGDLAVVRTNNFQQSSVSIYDPQANFKRSLDLRSVGICDIACLGNDIFVSDFIEGAVYVFYANRNYASTKINTNTTGINGICVNQDRLFVCSEYEHLVYEMKWDKRGSFFKRVFANQSTSQALKRPWFVAANDNTVIVSCYESKTLIAYHSDGSLRFHYICQEEWIYGPMSVCIDQRGFIMVANTDNHEIWCLHSSEKFLGLMTIKSPSYLVNDGNGKFYVTGLNSNLVYHCKYKLTT